MQPRLLLLIAALAVGCSTAGHAAGTMPSYRKFTLSDKFFCEGAAFGDFNHDGIMDVVSGPYWYAGPDFKERTEFYPASTYDAANYYSENFFSFTHDFNNDGWTDILVIGFPGNDASWYENPGARGGAWRRHVVLFPVDNESPMLVDLFSNRQPVLLCMRGGYLGYATTTFNPKGPFDPWVFHPVSPPNPWQRFTHGLGYGDINGDGRMDILEKDGWWEQPASLAGNPVWKKHPTKFGNGGAQMYAYDINGDGLNDVVTCIEAHGYGLSWFEQKRGAPGAEPEFIEHAITSRLPDEKLNGVQFAQPHAVTLADVDGDGVPDIISGKRYWAHGPKGDKDPSGTPVLYAFLTRRGPNHTATFEPHLIDDASGVGTQVYAADANGDGRPDIVVGNKRGTFVFISQPGGAKK